MKQYLALLENIAENGTDKPGAREGMPGTTSLFGPQIEMDLRHGFPLLTTKKMPFKMIVTELIWFLRGDTNIKYLVDNGCNIWNEDAYNYYKKLHKKVTGKDSAPFPFDTFIEIIKDTSKDTPKGLYGLKSTSICEKIPTYNLGDCGFQYGRVWREWETGKSITVDTGETYPSGEKKLESKKKTIDQITNLVHSLKNNPQSRRHLVTAIDPAHDQDLALYWCHALFQFNCRPLTLEDRVEMAIYKYEIVDCEWTKDNTEEMCDRYEIPKYYIDCKLYQRSADVILGVPFNIASYALLIEIISKMVNMEPGKFIHSFGDVHIYENHTSAFLEQKEREPYQLPRLEFDKSFINHLVQWSMGDVWFTHEMISTLQPEWFRVVDYKSHPKIKAKLSTGLK